MSWASASRSNKLTPTSAASVSAVSTDATNRPAGRISSNCSGVRSSIMSAASVRSPRLTDGNGPRVVVNLQQQHPTSRVPSQDIGSVDVHAGNAIAGGVNLAERGRQPHLTGRAAFGIGRHLKRQLGARCADRADLAGDRTRIGTRQRSAQIAFLAVLVWTPRAIVTRPVGDTETVLAGHLVDIAHIFQSARQSRVQP